jgi:hypothetical protein
MSEAFGAFTPFFQAIGWVVGCVKRTVRKIRWL